MARTSDWHLSLRCRKAWSPRTLSTVSSDFETHSTPSKIDQKLSNSWKDERCCGRSKRIATPSSAVTVRWNQQLRIPATCYSATSSSSQFMVRRSLTRRRKICWTRLITNFSVAMYSRHSSSLDSKVSPLNPTGTLKWAPRRQTVSETPLRRASWITTRQGWERLAPMD